MYFYEVGYHSHEGSSYRQFTHERELSREGFLSAVRDCMLVSLRSEDGPKLEDEFPTEFSTVLRRPAFTEAMKDRGFALLEFTEGFNVFGWASATDSDDWECHVDSEQKALAAWLREKVTEGK